LKTGVSQIELKGALKQELLISQIKKKSIKGILFIGTENMTASFVGVIHKYISLLGDVALFIFSHISFLLLGDRKHLITNGIND